MTPYLIFFFTKIHQQAHLGFFFWDGNVISKFKYAPITSVKVERSFSPFKNMLLIE
jgi:hypothetical protein